IPADAQILVVSDGADELLHLGRGTVAHFPRPSAGAEGGPLPSDSDEAILLLEQEVRAGANYLLIPCTNAEWLESLPAFAGYLRLPETREEQAQLAAEAGIEAFSYYHYWFHGRRLLETPFAEVLASGRPDFPFCLCWANEPWSRRWDGTDDDVLQAQSYSPEDDLEHIRWLLPALTDPRALTVDGKPVFLVYDVRALPDPARTTDLWRREARAAGLKGLHLIAVEKHHAVGADATRAGFDATVRFQPDFTTMLGLPSL